MKRRHALLATAGAAAGVAGVAVNWWLMSSYKGDGSAAPAAAPGDPDAAAQAFWQSSFAQPDGATLAMSSLRGTPLVVNFWATWCPPCVREMPELDRFAKLFASRGGRVLGLAVDNATAVRDFLGRSPVSYAIALAGFDGTELSRALGNTTGALPYTAVFDRRGAVVQRKLGTTDNQELTRWTGLL